MLILLCGILGTGILPLISKVSVRSDLVPGQIWNLNIHDPASDPTPIPNLKRSSIDITYFLIIVSEIVYGPKCKKLSDSASFSFLLNWLIENNLFLWE
jgi:hypothetical protein